MGLGFDYHALTDKFDIRRINANFQKLENIGMVNPNLLDNCDFANPLNSEGIISGQQYTSGRFLSGWTIGTSGYPVVWTTGSGVALSTNAGIYQDIDCLYSNLLGKEHTFTLLVDGEYYPVTGAFPSSVNAQSVQNNYTVTGVGVVSFGFEYRSAGVYVDEVLQYYVPYVIFIASAALTVKAVKLETGKASTLVNDIPKNVSEERSVYEKFYKAVNGQHGGYAYGDYAHIFVPTAKRMRINPTVLSVYGELMLINAIVTFSTATATAYDCGVQVDLLLSSPSGAAIANFNGSMILDARF